MPEQKPPPQRIQRQRTKGWRMPANTIYVGRPTYFGNPLRPDYFWRAGYSGDLRVALAACVQGFREWLTPNAKWSLVWPEQIRLWLEATRAERIARLPELRGKNLACWCKEGDPCHADILLE